jgi:hypothetical protein
MVGSIRSDHLYAKPHLIAKYKLDDDFVFMDRLKNDITNTLKLQEVTTKQMMSMILDSANFANNSDLSETEITSERSASKKLWLGLAMRLPLTKDHSSVLAETDTDQILAEKYSLETIQEYGLDLDNILDHTLKIIKSGKKLINKLDKCADNDNELANQLELINSIDEVSIVSKSKKSVKNHIMIANN